MTDEYIAMRETFRKRSCLESVPKGQPPEKIKRFVRELVFLEDWEAFDLIVGSVMRWTRSSVEEMNAQNIKQANLSGMGPSEN